MYFRDSFPGTYEQFLYEKKLKYGVMCSSDAANQVVPLGEVVIVLDVIHYKYSKIFDKRNSGVSATGKV